MKYLFSFLTLLVYAGISVVGQNGLPADKYLDLIEVSTNSKFSDTLQYSHGIVDFQSELVIKLNRSEIVSQMLIMQGVSRDDSRLEALYRLNTILDMEVAAMRQMNELVLLDQSGQEKPFELIRKMAQTENRIIEELEKDSVLSDRVNGAEGEVEYDKLSTENSSYTFLQYMFFVLNEEAARLQQGFIEQIEEDTQGDSAKSVFFRLGAFVQNKQGGYPIHVENFDSYSPQEYSQSLSTSEGLLPEEKAALTSISEKGETLRQGLSTTENGIASLLKSGDDLFEAKSKYDSLKNIVEISQQQLKGMSENDPESEEILHRVNLDLEQVSLLYSTLKLSVGSVSTDLFSGSTSINRIQARLTQFDSLVNQSFNTYSQGLEEYEQELSQPAGNARMDIFRNVSTRFKEYRSAVKADITGISSFLKKSADLLNPLKKNTLENDQFTNKVRRFSFNNLPDQGLITLTTSGARPGEDIVIKAVIQRGTSPGDRFFEEIILSRRVIRLERVSAHLKMGGSLILANPYNPAVTSDTISLGGSFQFAPSYTIFMSWGSRRSRFYNNYLGFGLGLGFSSPDFNLDGTPEFGVSVMATALQDIVSVGWGWNFGVDTPFWHVGFNIPFTVGGISNLGSTQAISR